MPDKTPSAVSGFYDGIFHYYETVNAFLTLGLHGRWRREAARAALVLKPERVLDVCCGAGDLSAELYKLSRVTASITGLDFNGHMLAKARKKVPGVEFLHSEAATLPFPDGFFDALTISFSARNLGFGNDLTVYFTEFCRVLKPGGVFINLETSQPGNRFVRLLFHIYVRLMTGLVKAVLPKTKTAYDFLSESIAVFYSPDELSKIITKAGLSNVKVRHFMFGAVAIHKAIK